MRHSVATANQRREEKKIAEAKRLESERQALAALPRSDDKSGVVGMWLHKAGNGEPGKLMLHPDGKINNPNGPDTWTLTGKTLVLRWANPRAPGGFWIDTCALSDDGKTYRGFNQQNAPIDGWKNPVADVAGVWAHEAGGFPELLHELTLHSNGKINNPNGQDNWTLTGKVLVLRWADTRAPGGFWIDTCKVSDDGLSYAGSNQARVSIRGWKGGFPRWYNPARRQKLLDMARENIQHRNEVAKQIREQNAKDPEVARREAIIAGLTEQQWERFSKLPPVWQDWLLTPALPLPSFAEWFNRVGNAGAQADAANRELNAKQKHDLDAANPRR